MKQVDLAIVGAGIMGLAHAFHATRAGLSVAVFDRAADTNGATVRNFGMLAVVAQAPGAQLASARRSLAHWQEIAQQAGIAMRRAGCLFLARTPQEMVVLEESTQFEGPEGHTLSLLSRDELAGMASNLQIQNLLGGVWSPDAWKLDQRDAPGKIANWLQSEHKVTFHFSTEVHGVESGVLETSGGTFKARHVILCGGDDFETLFKDEFRAAGVKLCQLQMLRTSPQPNDWVLDPFVLGGLSLTRYNVFANCPGLAALKAHQEKHQAAHLKHGIHVIACQEPDGSITIGDSHDYSPDSGRSDEIDELILSDLTGMLALPDASISEKWLGHYAYLPGHDSLKITPMHGVSAITMTNGQGMTHSLSLAEDHIQEIFG